MKTNKPKLINNALFLAINHKVADKVYDATKDYAREKFGDDLISIALFNMDDIGKSKIIKLLEKDITKNGLEELEAEINNYDFLIIEKIY